jgi:alpha-galactosidase
MLYYAPQAWTSDDTDAVERLKIQYGTSLVYPLSSMGAHVSEVPNHQVRRVTSLNTRGNTAFFGVFGYELDVTKMTDGEKEQVKAQVDFYKKHRITLQYGDFYRLISPFEGDGNVTSWMTVSSDRKEAIAGYYQVLSKPNHGYERLLLKGLHPDKEYRINGRDGTYFGDELMHVGIQLDSGYSGTQLGGIEESGDFTSEIFIVSEVD